MNNETQYLKNFPKEVRYRGLGENVFDVPTYTFGDNIWSEYTQCRDPYEDNGYEPTGWWGTTNRKCVRKPFESSAYNKSAKEAKQILVNGIPSKKKEANENILRWCQAHDGGVGSGNFYKGSDDCNIYVGDELKSLNKDTKIDSLIKCCVDGPPQSCGNLKKGLGLCSSHSKYLEYINNTDIINQQRILDQCCSISPSGGCGPLTNDDQRCIDHNSYINELKNADITKEYEIYKKCFSDNSSENCGTLNKNHPKYTYLKNKFKLYNQYDNYIENDNINESNKILENCCSSDNIEGCGPINKNNEICKIYNKKYDELQELKKEPTKNNALISSSISSCCNLEKPSKECGKLAPKSNICKDESLDSCKTDITNSSCTYLQNNFLEVYNDKLKDICKLDSVNYNTNSSQSVCKNYYISNEDNINKLKDFCKTNQNPEYDDLCACYKGNDFYSKIKSNIMDLWEGPVPKNVISDNPALIYPRCFTSGVYDQTKIPKDKLNIAECGNYDAHDDGTVSNYKPTCDNNLKIIGYNPDGTKRANNAAANNAAANSKSANNAAANSKTANNAAANSKSANNAAANSKSANNAAANSKSANNAAANSKSANNDAALAAKTSQATPTTEDTEEQEDAYLVYAAFFIIIAFIFAGAAVMLSYSDSNENTFGGTQYYSEYIN